MPKNESMNENGAVVPSTALFSGPECPDKVLLFSDGLLSKWGFNDGDLLDWLFDYDEKFDIHAVLRAVVREKLLPALTDKVEVFDIDTIHNPIRAQTVNGVDVTQNLYDPDQPIRLQPQFVEVSVEEVLRIARTITENPCVQGGGTL